jgi:hypothetical protein
VVVVITTSFLLLRNSLWTEHVSVWPFACWGDGVWVVSGFCLLSIKLMCTHSWSGFYMSIYF